MLKSSWTPRIRQMLARCEQRFGSMPVLLARRFAPEGETDQSGVTAVEFALIMPVLLLILAGVVDVSRMFWYQSEITQALRAGMEYATGNTSDYVGINSVMDASTSLSSAPGYSNTSNQCACATTSLSSLSWSPCSTLTCLPTQRRYVQLTATYNWSQIFGTMAFLPDTLSGSLAVRVQ